MPFHGVLCFVSSNIKPPFVGSLSDEKHVGGVMSFLEGQWVEQQMSWKFSGWLMHFFEKSVCVLDPWTVPEVILSRIVNPKSSTAHPLSSQKI